jgi:hypothetical protein
MVWGAFEPVLAVKVLFRHGWDGSGSESALLYQETP